MKNVLGVVAVVLLAGCNGGVSGGGRRASATTSAVTSGTTGATTSAVASSTPAGPTRPPAAPTGLTARVVNIRAVELRWTDASTDEDGFAIERRAASGTAPFAEVGRVAQDVVTARDVAPALATRYEYRVVARNAAGSSAPSNVVTVETGKGELFSRATLPTGGVPRRLATGDLDGDGDVDVAVANEDPSTPDQVLWNDGRGVLSDSGQALFNSYSSTVLAADLDGDRDLDLAFGNGDGSGISLFWNDGRGQFGQTVGNLDVGNFVRALAAVDVDQDGDQDLVVGHNGWVQDMIFKYVGNHDFVPGDTLGQNAAQGIVTGDVDGDARPDVVIGGDFGVTAWLAAGAGAFRAAPAVNLGFQTYTLSLALGDVDGDRDLDLAVGSLSGAVRTLVNDGRGGFTLAATLGGSVRETWSLALGDMDGDGDLDLVNGKGDATPWSMLYTNDGAGAFTAGPTTPLAIRSHALADMDRDGDLDVVASNVFNYSSPPVAGGVGVHENR